MSRPRVAIVLNSAWNLFNFRSGLIRALLDQGLDVVTVSPDDGYAARLTETGCRHLAIPMDTTGTHPFKDMLLLWRLWRAFRTEKPTCVLAYTAKPNIYASLAAHSLGIPVVNNVAGLGTAFMRGRILSSIVSNLYRLAFRRSRRIFFQNADDLNAFVSLQIVPGILAKQLPGSGVDLVRFRPVPLPKRQETIFLLVSRLLWDKGIGEYVEAARAVRMVNPSAKFQILGFLCPDHPAGVPKAELDKWGKEGLIEYLGETDDVRPYVANADCIVLPSYREGTPRSLLEAAAMARPVITTDAPGCRDVVDNGRTGFLCMPGSSDDLRKRIEDFLGLSGESRSLMAQLSREKAERQFDEQIVIQMYLDEVLAISCSQGGESPTTTRVRD